MMVSTTAVSSDQPAPNGLGLVIDFVNTLDIDSGVDELADAAALARWLAGRGLRDPSEAPVSRADHRRAVALRRALLSLMLANNGGAVDAEPWAELERAAGRGSLRAHFVGAGDARLGPEGSGTNAALARLLIPVFDSLRDGTWVRTKACRADDCNWAFYDRSRNRSATWCDMAVCGNREKVRAFRERASERG